VSENDNKVTPDYDQSGIPGWNTPPGLIPGFPEYQIRLGLAIDFIFICSFFVPGSDFRDKLWALFIHKVQVQFPKS